MFGAGKRKIKLPARYAASPAEDDPEWLSTPTDNLAEQLDNEILDVSRRIEQMKVDMGLENRTESTSTPLPTHGDVIGQRSTIPEALAQDPQDGRHQRLSTRAPKPIAPPDGHYPTLREVRAFHKAHNDPSIFTQYFPRQTGGTHVADTIRSSDGRPMQFNLQHVSDEDAHPPTQEGGLTAGCSKLCGIVGNKTDSKAVELACDALCTLVGFDEFVNAFNKADVDPIYYCEQLNQCPIVDNGDATITLLSVNPKSGPQGTFLIDLEYETKNGTGTGELLIYLDTVDGLPIGSSFLNEPQDPGKYGVKLNLNAVPPQGCEVACESFEPGVYNITMHVCNGQCYSKHPHSKIYDMKKTNFTITGPPPTPSP